MKILYLKRKINYKTFYDFRKFFKNVVVEINKGIFKFTYLIF